MKRAIKFIFVLGLSVSFLSCESAEVVQDKSVELINAQKLADLVKGISINPASSSNIEVLKLSITFREEILNYQMPDGFTLSGFPEVSPLLRDESDYTRYSSITASERIRKIYIESQGDVNKGDILSGFEFGCKFSVTSPGEYDSNCKKRCPEKSILGGSTIFCVCVFECEFGWK